MEDFYSPALEELEKAIEEAEEAIKVASTFIALISDLRSELEALHSVDAKRRQSLELPFQA